MQLSAREGAILETLVELFVRDAGPVSSAHIQTEIGLGVSSATIRNVLHRLEALGLLHQPHTSAGRVPTPAGYRMYVHSFCRPARLPGQWLRRIRQELAVDAGRHDVRELLARISRLLAALSNNVGFGLAVEEHLDARILKLEIVPLEHERLLVVVTLDDGMVRTCLVPLERRISPRALERAASLLHEIVAGCTPGEARLRLDVALEYRLGEAGEIARTVAQEKERIFEEPSNRAVHLEGATQIIGQPEFRDPENLRLLVRILDHPEELGAVLREQPSGAGTLITIGVESAHERLPFSLVSARVGLAGWEGRIGILGPMRMRYALAIALVGQVAEILGSPDDGRVQAH